MIDAAQAADIFARAAELTQNDPLLDGSQLILPNYGQVVMTGDLHGHRRNFEKLQQYCALEHAGARHVILHEIIHSDVDSLVAADDSHEVFLDAARWKCEYPDQVHFILSNHELAQINKHEITKNGRIVTQAFEESIADAYGRGADRVLAAMYALIRSYPVAARTPNRILLTHSLPSARELATFDPSVLSRRLTNDDLNEHGSAHALVWGRYQSEIVLDELCTMLDADYFICGHQPQEDGYAVLCDRMIILASEHNHGVFLPIDLSKPQTIETLTGNIRPFAGVALAAG